MSSYYTVTNPQTFGVNRGTPIPDIQPYLTQVPPGVISQYAGATCPSEYLFCDGSAVSRVTYYALYHAIGTLYGSGDGVTTFNLPNLKGKIPVCLDTGITQFNSLANVGGEMTHTLTTDEIPSHSHTGTTDISGLHNHTSNAVGGYGNPGLCIADGSQTATSVDSSANELKLWTNPLGLTIDNGGSHTHTITTTNTGGGQPHNNLQPYIVVNYIIKT